MSPLWRHPVMWRHGQHAQSIAHTKGKGCHILLQGCRRGAYLPCLCRDPVGGKTTKVYDAWPVRRQTYGGYLPSRRASPPVGRYKIILLGDRGTWVWTTYPEFLSGNAPAGSWSRNLLIASPTPYSHYATEPPIGKFILAVHWNHPTIWPRFRDI